MSNKPISTKPPSIIDEKLLEKFAESIAGQSERLDDLAKLLITVELAIPGIYAAVLKMRYGDKAMLSDNWLLYITFGCWLFSLLLTLCGLFPRRRIVDRSLMKRDSKDKNSDMGIEDYFTVTARYKIKFIGAACVCFIIGVFCAPFIIL